MQDHSQRLLLFYNSAWGQFPELPPSGSPTGWMVSCDPARLPDADAVVFHVPCMRGRWWPRKRAGQRWVLWSMESEDQYPRLRQRRFLRRFDLTMTFHLQTDVFLSYIPADLEEWLSRSQLPKSGEKRVTALISNHRDCNGRRAYLKELMRHADVHSYGRVLQNRSLADDHGRLSKLNLYREYQFVLAFENSNVEDYVSEKMYEVLAAGAVPVYLGAPNVHRFVPGDHCLINVCDFEGPRDLAQYLLSLNPAGPAYAEYLAWRRQPWRPSFLAMRERGRENVVVQLCRELDRKRTGEDGPRTPSDP